jgi:hypothetical protein
MVSPCPPHTIAVDFISGDNRIDYVSLLINEVLTFDVFF